MEIDPSLLAADKIRPLSRAEYDRMVELGFFDEDEHIELLEGLLVKMSPQGWQHAAVIQRISKVLSRGIDESLAVRSQLPFAAGSYSEPEPDIVVVRDDRTVRDHPSAALLIVEVSGESLEYDRETKLVAYARAKVPEYWIVDLARMAVEVHTRPTRNRYARKRLLRDGDVLRPTMLPGIEIAVADLPR